MRMRVDFIFDGIPGQEFVEVPDTYPGNLDSYIQASKAFWCRVEELGARTIEPGTAWIPPIVHGPRLLTVGPV